MASLVSLKKERDDRTRQVLVDTDKSLADKVMPSPEAIDLSVEHIIKIQCAVRVFKAKKKIERCMLQQFHLHPLKNNETKPFSNLLLTALLFQYNL